jgi:FkbM family methyltransferase
MAEPLILDIGMHLGEDTEFYLKKGFRVLAVEANPAHAAACRKAFEGALADGRLRIVEAAIADRDGHVEFYVNLDKDDWSSTDPEYGTRAGTRFEKITVPCVRFESLLGYVQPGEEIYYVKSDIEGGDIDVLRGMVRCGCRPRYASFEAHSSLYACYLAVLGYDRFKLTNQNLNWAQQCPNPPKEGRYAEHVFGPHSSGPFGEETPGKWMKLDDFMELFMTLERTRKLEPALTTAWYDIHAKKA